MFKFEPVRRIFMLARISLCFAEWSSRDPCTELDRAIDVLIPAVRNSAKQIDQASNAQKVADAINAYADAAEQVGEDDTAAEATVGKAACGRAGSLPSSQPAA